MLVGAHAGFELLARFGGFVFGLGLFLGNFGSDVAVFFQTVVGGKKTHAGGCAHGGHPVALDVLGRMVDRTELVDGEAAHRPGEHQDQQERADQLGGNLKIVEPFHRGTSMELQMRQRATTVGD